MQVTDVFSYLVKRSGMSARALSLSLGKADTWARNSAGRDTKLSTVTTVADVAGLDLALIDRETGEAVAVIDPPDRREATEE